MDNNAVHNGEYRDGLATVNSSTYIHTAHRHLPSTDDVYSISRSLTIVYKHTYVHTATLQYSCTQPTEYTLTDVHIHTILHVHNMCVLYVHLAAV